MRAPSRRMHDVESVQAPLSFHLLPAIPLACLPWSITLQPMLPLVLAGVVLLVGQQLRRERDHLLRLAAQRQGESICQFARAFPRREVDAWVIRAVYESLSRYIGGHLPIRADDQLKQDLWLDDDDLDLDLLDEMARLCGRSLERGEENPWFGRVERVRDLVLFLNRQPVLAA